MIIALTAITSLILGVLVVIVIQLAVILSRTKR